MVGELKSRAFKCQSVRPSLISWLRHGWSKVSIEGFYMKTCPELIKDIDVYNNQTNMTVLKMVPFNQKLIEAYEMAWYTTGQVGHINEKLNSPIHIDTN